MNNYPRMLYRPGSGPAEVWGEFVDTRIVQTEAEEWRTVREGWMVDPSKACRTAKRRRLLRANWQRFAKHWQFWISTAVAVAGLIVAFFAIK